MERIPHHRPAASALVAAAASFGLAGCDPIIDISGAYFPAWFMCMLGGIGLVWGGHRVLSRLGVMPWIAPRLLVLLCGYVSAVLFLWLIIFAT